MSKAKSRIEELEAENSKLKARRVGRPKLSKEEKKIPFVLFLSKSTIERHGSKAKLKKFLENYAITNQMEELIKLVDKIII